MVTAYILIHAHVGQAAEVRDHVLRIDGVKSAAVVSGPYDLIVYAEVPDMRELGKLVRQEIQAVDGVTRTLTCPELHI